MSGVPRGVEARRARLVHRHLLDGSGASTLAATRAVLALHATDPASVYLSVLARCRHLDIGQVTAQLYDDRALIRMLAMRRTLFVVPQDLAAVLHHAAALDVAATLRKRLVKELSTAPTDPPVPGDVEGWLAEVERGVAAALQDLGSASGGDLSRAEPRLRTAVLPTTDKAYDVRRTITTTVLTLMGAEGRIVRGRPGGGWTSRQHSWEPASAVWPDGLPTLEVDDARRRLVAEYLRRFGPATERDVAWWTGWPLGVTRRALAGLELAGAGGGLVLADDGLTEAPPPPVAALLPALDPTPMGWKERDWYLPEDPSPLFDRSGNVGPTVWWAGEVVGGWAVRPDGRVVTALLVDRGREAATAVTAAADALQQRLEGAVVVPSFRTPLERTLATG